MDTPTPITHVSLCAGYGGIDLGLRRAIGAVRTIAFSEIEAFAVANLVAKMEAGLLDVAPIWSNLKTFPWADFHGLVDILSGGYPCQPFSAAGKRLGTEDPRHLWPFIAAGIRLMRPAVCFFENVEGHISLGLREVISELEGLGYRTTWGIFSAAEVGATHQRKRVFILAVSDRFGGAARISGQIKRQEGPPGESIDGRGFGAVADAEHRPGCAEQRAESREWPSQGPEQVPMPWPSRPGEPQHEWEPPRVLNTFTRIANRHGRIVADGKRLRKHQQEGREPELGGRSADCGDGMGDTTGRDGQRPPQREAGHATQPDQSVGNAERSEWRPESSASDVADGHESRRDQGAGRAGESGEGPVADTESAEPRGMRGGNEPEESRLTELDNARGRNIRQAQPSLGGGADGPAYRLDAPELHTATDNRTDELRLLGNGVVPATAERAFVTLWAELNP